MLCDWYVNSSAYYLGPKVKKIMLVRSQDFQLILQLGPGIFDLYTGWIPELVDDTLVGYQSFLKVHNVLYC